MMCAVHNEWRKPILKSLGEQIRQARETHGLSQVELAHRACVPRANVRKLESGTNVTLNTLMDILIALPELTSLHIRHVNVKVLRYEIASLAGQLQDIAAAVAESAGTAAAGVLAEEGVNGARANG